MSYFCCEKIFTISGNTIAGTITNGTVNYTGNSGIVNVQNLQFNNNSITNTILKLKLKINYYKVASLVSKKTKYNRLSFYYFDKYAIMNLCKIVYHNKNYNISGVYQKNAHSFWFPDLLVYKMNIQEYIFFNPSHNKF